MSTLAYAALVRIEEGTARRRATGDEAPDGIPKYLKVMASLVPAEVLALHAIVLSFTTETTNGIVKITERPTLSGAFYGLVVLSIVLFAVPRILSGWKRWDWLRTALAPFAFVIWTALQKATAFDAVSWSLDQAPRTAGALGAAALLALVSASIPRETKPPAPARRGHDGARSRALFYWEEAMTSSGEVEQEAGTPIDRVPLERDDAGVDRGWTR